MSPDHCHGPEIFSIEYPQRYRRILSRFDDEIQSPDGDVDPPQLSHKVPILGFSATFSRHDGLALGSVFEEIVYHRDFLEMIKEQWCVFSSSCRDFVSPSLSLCKALQRAIHHGPGEHRPQRGHSQLADW